MATFTLRKTRLFRSVLSGLAIWGMVIAAQATTVPPGSSAPLPDCTGNERKHAEGSYSGSLARASGCELTVAAPPGSVIQAEYDSQGVTLDLQDENGNHLRRLGHADHSAQSIMWVAGNQPGRLVLRHTGNSEGRYTFRLQNVFAPKTGHEARTPESPALRELKQILDAGGNTDAFWSERARVGTPLIEPLSDQESLVTFLWRGHEENVRLFGSPSGNHDPMQRLGNSDVWWATFRMPNTARLSYRIAPQVPKIDGTPMQQRRVILATAQRDPLNPTVFPDTANTAVDIYQGSSAFSLSKAPPQPWSTPREDLASGTLIRHPFDSDLLKNRRDIWTYQPVSGEPGALLVLFDAHAYLNQVNAPAIIDNLMADGLIPPVTIVLVGNASPQARGRELPPNELFMQFLDKELMPWIAGQGLGQPASRTVIAGSSYGGLASAYAGLRLPHRFGNVLSLSGSYWWAPEGEAGGWMMRRYAETPANNVRFYLDAGRYESTRAGRLGILETNRHLADVLRARGYDVTQVEHDTGHDYFHWQGSLACGLIALLNPEVYRGGLKACPQGLLD